MSAKLPAIVPGLFDRHSVNLIVGSSGSGKTQLLLNQTSEYLDGRGFLGYGYDRGDGSAEPPKLPPVQVGLMSCIQSYEHFFYASGQLPTLTNQRRFPIHMVRRREGMTDLENLLENYQGLCEYSDFPVRFLIIEGIQLLMESGKTNDPKTVREFCSTLARFCSDQDVTILGTTLTAKMKRGEYYPQLGDRILGAGSWGEGAQTLIGIEQKDLHLPFDRRTSIRRVLVQTREAHSKVLYADFDEEGRLSIITPPAAATVPSKSFLALDTMLDDLTPGTELRREDLEDWAEAITKTYRTVERWLDARIEEGFIEKVGNTKPAVYRKPHQQ